MDLTDKIIKDYSYYLRIERAMSPNTVSSYSSDVKAFFDAVPSEPSQVVTGDVSDYLESRGTLSKRSQARLLSSPNSGGTFPKSFPSTKCRPLWIRWT